MLAHCITVVILTFLISADAKKCAFPGNNPCQNYEQKMRAVIRENYESPEFPQCYKYKGSEMKEIDTIKMELFGTCDAMESLKLTVKLVEKWIALPQQEIERLKNCSAEITQYVKTKVNEEPSEKCKEYQEEIKKYRDTVKKLHCEE